MLASLDPFDKEGRLRVVVETPRGSTLKYKFDPALDAFTIARQLMLGLAYPYDFGFVPGTRAQDGDPVDVMVLHSQASYPGIVLPCRALGAVIVEQKEKGRIVANHRLIARPDWEAHAPLVEDASKLPTPQRRELEQFFLNTSFFTSKKLRIVGWRGARAALKLVEQARAG